MKARDKNERIEQIMGTKPCPYKDEVKTMLHIFAKPLNKYSDDELGALRGFACDEIDEWTRFLMRLDKERKKRKLKL